MTLQSYWKCLKCTRRQSQEWPFLRFFGDSDEFFHSKWGDQKRILWILHIIIHNIRNNIHNIRWLCQQNIWTLEYIFDISRDLEISKSRHLEILACFMTTLKFSFKLFITFYRACMLTSTSRLGGLGLGGPWKEVLRSNYGTSPACMFG